MGSSRFSLGTFEGIIISYEIGRTVSIERRGYAGRVGWFWTLKLSWLSRAAKSKRSKR